MRLPRLRRHQRRHGDRGAEAQPGGDDGNGAVAGKLNEGAAEDRPDGGADRGYGVAQITGVLIALGFVNLLPAPLAAWLQHRLRARGVLIAGPLVQAAVCALIMTRSSFQVYAAAA